MGMTYPAFDVVLADGTEVHIVSIAGDLAMLEELEHTSLAKIEFGILQLARLAWIVMRRIHHPKATATVDEFLAVFADVEMVPDGGAEGKPSAPAA